MVMFLFSVAYKAHVLYSPLAAITSSLTIERIVVISIGESWANTRMMTGKIACVLALEIVWRGDSQYAARITALIHFQWMYDFMENGPFATICQLLQSHHIQFINNKANIWISVHLRLVLSRNRIGYDANHRQLNQSHKRDSKKIKQFTYYNL